MRRLDIFPLGGAIARAALERARAAAPVLCITKVEAFVLRPPKHNTPPEKFIDMPPAGP